MRGITWKQSFSRYFTISASLLLLVLASTVFFNSSPASATSIYDSPATDAKIMAGRNSCTNDYNTVDMTAIWATTIRDLGTAGDTNALNTFNKINDTPEDYYWTVYNNDTDNSGNRWFTLLVTPSSTTTGFTFRDGNYGVSGYFGDYYSKKFMYINTTSYDYYQVNVRVNNSCNGFTTSGWDGSTSGDPWLSTNTGAKLAIPVFAGYSPLGNGRISKIVFNNAPFFPPSGYEGPSIPGGIDTPPSDQVPDLELLSGTSYNVVVRDNNFNTFDDPPFLCESELAPVIHYEIFFGWDSSTDELIYTGSQSPTANINYTIPFDKAGEFKILAYYECGEGDIQFTESTVLEFSAYPPEPSDYVPDLNVLTATGFYVVIQDTNFNTFDDVPFLCLSETTPIMHYELYKNDSLIDSGFISPTVTYTRTLDREAASYSFVAWYDCGAGDLIFDQSAVKNFALSQFGTLVTGCEENIGGFFCQMGSVMQFGIISSTLNGITGIVNQVGQITPTYCNTNWVSDQSFTSTIFPIQDVPGSICNGAEQMLLGNTAPFSIVNFWENMLLKGAALMLLVFGILSMFGINVRLPSPIQDEPDTQAPAGQHSGQGEGFGSRRKYLGSSGKAAKGASRIAAAGRRRI